MIALAFYQPFIVMRSSTDCYDHAMIKKTRQIEIILESGIGFSWPVQILYMSSASHTEPETSEPKKFRTAHTLSIRPKEIGFITSFFCRHDPRPVNFRSNATVPLPKRPLTFPFAQHTVAPRSPLCGSLSTTVPTNYSDKARSRRSILMSGCRMN